METSKILLRRINRLIHKQEHEVIMTHRNGILFYETTVFSEIDCDNFIQNMKIKFDELATKHSNELKGISNH